MAASSSSTTPPLKHDVFLSFRGEDTRKNFTSHLHKALCGKMIATFIDNELGRGDEISPSLLNAIEGSKISVIIFSKGYASSRWCLEELVKIIECKNFYRHIVIPVFYHVDPSHVRHRTGTFGGEFAKLQVQFQGRSEMIQRWRTALTEAANLSGWTLNENTSEADIVEDIVNDIVRRLEKVMPLSDNKNLLGVASTIKELTKLLLNTVGVCSIGIWGIGGIGKTTIARAIFDTISSQFQGFYFAENVTEESESPNGLAHLREKLLSTLLGDKNTNIGCSNTKNRIKGMKILIVFDDVTDLQQIEVLIEDYKSLGSKSRFIITTRDKQVLETCRVDRIYEVKGLSYPKDLHLFRKYAFRSDLIPDEYLQMSHKVVNYAKGLPLALKVLGSALFGRRNEFWESAINKLQDTHKNIYEVLKLSYDRLEDMEKDIFLDIVCFFKWQDKDLVIKILKASGFEAEYGITHLIDKSLIMISPYNEITMHDLLEEMGKKIAREERDLRKCNRLLDHMDVTAVLTRDMGTEAVEGIRLDMSKIKEIDLNSDAFAKMYNLRIFDFCCMNADLEIEYHLHKKCSCNKENSKKVIASQPLEFAFSDLTYFRWHRYPLKALPLGFNPEKLVALVMPHGEVEELWDGIQPLGNLVHVNLRHSKHLTKIPDLSEAPNLESLILEGCTSLIEIHSSIQKLNKLAIVNLSGCSNLKTVPSLPRRVRYLLLEGTAISKFDLPDDPPSLKLLTLRNCSRLDDLPSSFCNLKCLDSLDLSGCTILERLPDDIGKLEWLSEINISRTAIRELPESITKLKYLRSLELSGCSILERLPDDIEKLELLREINMSGTAIRELPESITQLKHLKSLYSLNLTGCKIIELPNSLGQFCLLGKLYLDDNNFKRIPATIKDLSNLRFLGLTNCKNLQSLPELGGGLYANMYNCVGLEELSADFINKEINLANCLKLDVNALGNKVKDCLLRIQKKAITREYGFSIFFTGNEIPEWFPNQKEGCSMIIDLPPDWKNKNFLGFVMCAVVEFSDVLNFEDLGVGCHCYTKDGGYRKHWFLDVWNRHTEYQEKCYETNLDIRQDIVFLGFIEIHNAYYEGDEDNEYFDSNDSNKAYIKFDAFNELHFGDYKVKKCGFHLVYGLDNNSSSFISDDVMEEQEEPFNFSEGESSSSINNSYFISDDILEEQEEPFNFSEGESSSRCGLHTINEKEVEEFNPITNPSNSHTHLDLSEFPQDFAQPTMDIVTTKRNLADHDGAKLRIGCSNEEPQPCCAPVTYGMQYNGFTLLDLSEFPQDFVGSAMDVSTNKRSLADCGGAEQDRNGCDEDDSQPKRLKEFKFL